MVETSSQVSERSQAIRNINWGWVLALGILMCVLGAIGFGIAYQLTLVAMFWFGILAVVGGVSQVFNAFKQKAWKSAIWHGLIGLVYILAGVLLIAVPVESAFWLTLLLAVSLVVTGVSRIIMAFQIRRHGSAWLAVLAFGLLSIFIGLSIYGTITPPTPEAMATAEGQLQWLRSWGWVIGTFVAIELLMEGVSLIMIALGARKAQSDATAA